MDAGAERVTGLEELQRAQARVEVLSRGSADPRGREFRAAMNRLMSLVRYAPPEVMAAFEAWRAGRQGET